MESVALSQSEGIELVPQAGPFLWGTQTVNCLSNSILKRSRGCRAVHGRSELF